MKIFLFSRVYFELCDCPDASGFMGFPAAGGDTVCGNPYCSESNILGLQFEPVCGSYGRPISFYGSFPGNGKVGRSLPAGSYRMDTSLWFLPLAGEGGPPP